MNPNPSRFPSNKKEKWAGEMAQCLRALAALPKVLSSNPSNYMVAPNPPPPGKSWSYKMAQYVKCFLDNHGDPSLGLDMVAYVCNPRSGEQNRLIPELASSSRLAKW